MTGPFADTSFYVAICSPRDGLHRKASNLAQQIRGPIVTTEYVLVETGNFFAQSQVRAAFVQLVQQLRNDPETEIIPASTNLFGRGLDVYRQRSDKDWGFTDCTSFVVMNDRGITEALTADHHFEQAGFTVLLK